MYVFGEKMENLKTVIAKNIVLLRTGEHLTQAELAEKLNYSDKAVSKWERGESLPDITVIKAIADLFGVTVDWLLRENGERPAPENNRKKSNRKMITLLAVCAVWFVAVVLFSILLMCGVGVQWLIFVAGVPATLIVLLVFNCIWGKRTLTMLIVSLLVWTLIAFIYLLLLTVFYNNFWPIFLIGIPAQAAVVFWYWIVRNNQK